MTSSIASPPKMSVAIEGSDSTSSTINQTRPNKRLKQDNLSSSSRFKGVVLQQNGHWGAQIYANHQRIWLGTFKSEVAAAMAYDSAAIKLRSGDSHRNFPWNNITIQEPNFQEFHQVEDVLNMIKDGSYNTKFAEFIRSLSSNNTANNDPLMGSINGEAICKPLFHKELTPSDVGKLNRLVIPKKHAIKHFPQVSEITGGEDINCVDDIQLIFCDKQLKPWKFRYCYWKSSQSFVFTRGWNRFVKDKKLKAKDIVNFYQCKWRREGFGEEKVFCMIDIDYYNRETHESRLNSDPIGHNTNLQLGLGCNIEPQRDENHEKKKTKKKWNRRHNQRKRREVLNYSEFK